MDSGARKRGAQMIVVTSRAQLPQGRHWVILKFSSVHIPGDERSRTNPGHGYPAHDEPTVSYQAYTDEQEWRAAINRLEAHPHDEYMAAEVRPANVVVQTSVRVSTDA